MLTNLIEGWKTLFRYMPRFFIVLDPVIEVPQILLVGYSDLLFYVLDNMNLSISMLCIITFLVNGAFCLLWNFLDTAS